MHYGNDHIQLFFSQLMLSPPPDTFYFKGARGKVENFMVSIGYDVDFIAPSIGGYERFERGYNYVSGRYIGSSLYDKTIFYKLYDDRIGDGKFLDAMKSVNLDHLIDKIE